MKIILRNKGLVIIQRDNGELWLTKRTHRPKDSRRRRRTKKSVFYIPIVRIPKKGDWLFTCKNYPVQYSHSPDLESLDQWFQYYETRQKPIDYFETLDGSSHSWSNCSLNLISDIYAQWYIDHKIFDLFYDPEDTYIWQHMEEKVRQLCKLCNISFEGI